MARVTAAPGAGLLTATRTAGGAPGVRISLDELLAVAEVLLDARDASRDAEQCDRLERAAAHLLLRAAPTVSRAPRLLRG